MQLELDADPNTIPHLAGLKPLTAVREGRPRVQTVKLVWHDSPDHALLSQRLTLAEAPGVWRLERVTPAAETWLPGQPPPVIEAAGQPTAFTESLPAPVAAFEGRRTTSLHRLAGTVVAVCVERGVLRSVTAERPVARLTLSGDEAAVRSAALLIAGALPVSVPRHSLAAQAVALATGGTATPRHLGAPILPDAGITVTDALAHILGHLTDVILHFAPTAARPEVRRSTAKAPDGKAAAGAPRDNRDPAVDGAEADPAEARRMEAVHQMRVAVRRALSALSIFRGALADGMLDPLREGLKDLGTRLGHTRDWDVFVSETAPAIIRALPPDERLERLIAAAVRQRRDRRKQLADYLQSPPFRVLTVQLAWFVAARFWHVGQEPPRDPAHGDPSPDPESTQAALSSVKAFRRKPAPGALPAEPSPDAPVHPPDEPLSATTAAEPQSVRTFAPAVLQQRWKKLLSAGKHIERLDIPSLHGVRLRAKRARYAAEMFAVSHEGKAAHRFIRRLSLLQQRLGVLNDGAVAAQLLDEIGGPAGRHAYAVGVVVGFTASRAERIRPRVIRAFEKFRRQPTYWT